MDHDMSNEDVLSSTELHEMDQADEARLDAEDDARNTAEVEAEEAADLDDGEPWTGLADGEER